jgi:hypothetical protein
MRRQVARCYCNNCNCNSLFTCFLSHQVSICTYMHSILFSAFFMHYPQCMILPVRTQHCHLLQCHFRDITLTPPRITNITLSQMTRAGSHFVPRIRHPLPTKVKKVENVKHFWTIHTLQPPPDQGEDVCKIWFRSVQKCEFV